MKLITRSVLVLLGSTSALSAATSFTEDFSDFSPNPNMALGTGFGSPTTSFAGGNFTITSGTGSRIYLGTLGTDYFSLTNDFTFTATFTMPSGASAWSSVFIGMGNANAVSASSGEPVSGSNLIMTVRSAGDIYSGDNVASGSFATTAQGSGTAPGTTAHLLQMFWNASTRQATFSYDGNGNGSFADAGDKSISLNGADNGFNASNSQLFIGGGHGLSIDNISVSVVPEPSTYGLMGAGALAGIAMVRRRRKHVGTAA